MDFEFAGIKIDSNGIKMPGMEIDSNGIKMPGMSVDKFGNVKMPGMEIDSNGGIKMPGMEINSNGDVRMSGMSVQNSGYNTCNINNDQFYVKDGNVYMNGKNTGIMSNNNGLSITSRNGNYKINGVDLLVDKNSLSPFIQKSFPLKKTPNTNSNLMIFSGLTMAFVGWMIRK